MLSFVSCKDKNNSPEQNGNVIGCKTEIDTMFTLTLRNNTFIHPIKMESIKKGSRFVKIKISKVSNPGVHFLSFAVYYQSVSTEKVLLGSFSLYPADNPGEFMVSTRNLVKTEGEIILVMTSPDNIPAKDSVIITGEKIYLTNQ